jgi:hypothetical protein
MDQMEATHISDTPESECVYLDRLYDHDAQIFKYGKVGSKPTLNNVEP